MTRRPFLVLAFAAMLAAAGPAWALDLYTEENPPINFSRDGKLAGLAVEVVQELLRRTHTTAPIHIVPWARGYQEARTHPDVALFVAVRTAEREPLFKWVGPVVTTTTSFYAKRGSTLHLTDLNEARALPRIGVPREWYSHQVLRQVGFQNLEQVSRPHEMARMLAYGRIPVMVYEDQLLPGLLAQVGMKPDEVVRVYTFMRSSSYIVFSLGTPDAVVQQWQQALDGMKQDGSFARIHERWLPGEPLPGLVAEPDILPAP